MADAGIAVSRSSLTNCTGRTIDLLRPVMEAQSARVLECRVLAMDETSVEAGRTGAGKMRQAYLWPMYRDDDEMVFHYASTREHRRVETFLGELRGTLPGEGYEAYASHAKRHGAVHAQCWSHCRRFLEQAKESEPQAGASALALTGGLYSIERDIRRSRVEGAAKRAIRESPSAPVAREFFAWSRGLRPRTTTVGTGADGCACRRRLSCSVHCPPGPGRRRVSVWRVSACGSRRRAG